MRNILRGIFSANPSARPEPAGSDSIRSEIAKRLDAVRGIPGAQETVRVEWREAALNLPVITMPLNSLRFNPETNRIRAQREFNLEKNKQLSENPWSTAAQSYLYELIKADPAHPANVDPEFENLKSSLRENGQEEPGIITADGVLVNGNTRCVALRDLGKANMRVAVLPTDATWSDIQSIETSLQMRRDHRREYSFVNLLLAIEAALRAKSPEQVAKDFRVRQATLDRNIWIYSFIQEAIDRSRIKAAQGSDNRLSLYDFEGHQGKLEELYRTYKSEPDSRKKELLKEARLAGIALDFSKTDLRNVADDFYSRYVSLPPSLDVVEVTHESSGFIPGLDIAAPPTDEIVAKATAITDAVLKLATQVKVSPGDQQSADLLVAVRSSFDSGLDLAGRTTRLKQKTQAAPDRMGDAADQLGQCALDLANSFANSVEELDALEEAAQSLRNALGRVANALGNRPTVEDTPALAWLVSATKLND
ncbi:MAG: hypothetical protein JSR89_17150 [Proteobacteria bacterium]|nr:hypothetical protein [Pseudomonadota bacterium]